jgi:hypothetical protein
MPLKTIRCRCGNTFNARLVDIKRGWGKYCSKSCKAYAQEKRTGQFAKLLHGGKSRKSVRQLENILTNMYDSDGNHQGNSEVLGRTLKQNTL